jgi:hypothetical protein
MLYLAYIMMTRKQLYVLGALFQYLNERQTIVAPSVAMVETMIDSLSIADLNTLAS